VAFEFYESEVATRFLSETSERSGSYVRQTARPVKFRYHPREGKVTPQKARWPRRERPRQLVAGFLFFLPKLTYPKHCSFGGHRARTVTGTAVSPRLLGTQQDWDLSAWQRGNRTRRDHDALIQALIHGYRIFFPVLRGKDGPHHATSLRKQGTWIRATLG
jgi:hypothetical protein